MAQSCLSTLAAYIFRKTTTCSAISLSANPYWGNLFSDGRSTFKPRGFGQRQGKRFASNCRSGDLAKWHAAHRGEVPFLDVETTLRDVEELVRGNFFLRTIAQIDIEFSNSMIEMLFYRLKHRYLFTIPLTNFAALEKGADFYFTESNTNIPHSALKGATPEEAVRGYRILLRHLHQLWRCRHL